MKEYLRNGKECVWLVRMERWEERGGDGVRVVTGGNHVGPFIRALCFTLSVMKPEEVSEQGGT